MPSITQHPPGALCWFELATTDQAGAKRFYASLFGWSSYDSAIGPDEMYTLFRLEGRDVAAVYTMREPERMQGVPPNWLIYVRVDDADTATARAETAGGTALAPPFEVMDLGRMAVLRDPIGAVFAIWQPGTHSGTGLTGQPGTAVWADLVTSDQVKAAAFYEQLFGWRMVEGKSLIPARPGQYFHIVNGADMIGGVPPGRTLPPGAPPHWLIYFSVADCRTAMARAQSLGGKTIHGPVTIENTRTFGALADPQGAVFAVVDRQG